MSSKVWTYLANNGPATLDELPYQPKNKDKRTGVRRFAPSMGGRGNSQSDGCGFISTGIYYIENKHTPDSVVRKWAEANERVVETRKNDSIHWNILSHDKNFKEASAKMFGPFDRNNGGGEWDQGGECDLCGESYSHSIAVHLPDCEAKP